MGMRLVLVALLVTLAGPLGATSRLSIRVSPAVAFAPANLFVRATVEANQENRAIEVIAESQEFYRSSEVQLDGDRAPRVAQFYFRSLPSGSYEVRAILKGSGGHEIAFVLSRLNVVDSGTANR
jgi:hypothetical protein